MLRARHLGCLGVMAEVNRENVEPQLPALAAHLWLLPIGSSRHAQCEQRQKGKTVSKPESNKATSGPRLFRTDCAVRGSDLTASEARRPSSIAKSDAALGAAAGRCHRTRDTIVSLISVSAKNGKGSQKEQMRQPWNRQTAAGDKSLPPARSVGRVSLSPWPSRPATRRTCARL
jgi:hypothetical protein